MIIILTFTTLHAKFTLDTKVNKRRMKQQKGEIIPQRLRLIKQNDSSLLQYL